MQDRPTAPELLDAVREFLEMEIVPTLDEHRLRFRTLIALNVLRIVQRELTGEEERLRGAWPRLVDLVEPGATAAPPTALADLRADVDRLRRDLCRRIRAGDADDGPWREAALAYARWECEEKLRISNPRHLAGADRASPDRG